jgi:hypothetical protein
LQDFRALKISRLEDDDPVKGVQQRCPANKPYYQGAQILGTEPGDGFRRNREIGKMMMKKKYCLR